MKKQWVLPCLQHVALFRSLWRCTFPMQDVNDEGASPYENNNNLRQVHSKNTTPHTDSLINHVLSVSHGYVAETRSGLQYHEKTTSINVRLHVQSLLEKRTVCPMIRCQNAFGTQSCETQPAGHPVQSGQNMRVWKTDPHRSSMEPHQCATKRTSFTMRWTSGLRLFQILPFL